MVVDLKKSIPVVVNPFLEISISGELITSKLDFCIKRLALEEFSVRAVITAGLLRYFSF